MNYDSFEDDNSRARRMPAPISRRDRAIDLYTPDAEYTRHSISASRPFNFWEYFHVLISRRWMILALVLLGMIATGLLTLTVSPLYKAGATIEVQREEAKILDSGSVDPVVVADAAYMATQYELLKSRTLAKRVAEILDLSSDPRYADQGLDHEARLNAAADKIIKNLLVSPKGRSRIISVQFVSPYPNETARITNAIVDNFIETNLERKYNTTAYARSFIEERLATAKTALEESERKLVEYADKQNILEIDSGTGSGSLDLNSLVSLNSELARAESERIAAEQRYLESKNGTTTRMLESDDLRRLRERRSEIDATYKRDLKTFKPSYPEMQALQSELNTIDEEIAAEKQNIVEALAAEFKAAQARETSLRSRVEELKKNVQDLRSRKIEYTILEREVDTNRSQYEALLQRLKEVSIANGVGSSQVSVIDRAIVPVTPFEPNLLRNLAIALVLSLAAGIGLALGLNYIDDTIKTPDDVQTKLGMATIGVIPKVLKGKDIVTKDLSDPRSAISEAVFSARTALQFITPGGAPRSILLTSTRPGEGKTSTTVALGMAFAKLGQRALIIDGDMRKPSFVAEAGSTIGLSGLLTREASLSENVIASDTEGLYLLPAGIVPPNPAQLLASPRLSQIIEEAEDMFDVVLIDSPPVLSFADAPLLGSVTEATVVVIQSGAIRTPFVARTIGRMAKSNANLIGTILTKFNSKKAGYGYGYYSYFYGNSAYAYGTKKKSVPSNSKRQIRIITPDGSSTNYQKK